ncbi:MAG: HPr family phosphocarrier protein [Eubacteriaceae bacterium]|nr:HPr family phosphocarrier protein [Eubacteriaceae bacterium]
MYIKKAKLCLVDPGSIKPVSTFVGAAKKFQSTITISSGNMHINAKSFRGLLASDLQVGSEVTLRAEGPDEIEAVSSLCQMISG